MAIIDLAVEVQDNTTDSTATVPSDGFMISGVFGVQQGSDYGGIAQIYRTVNGHTYSLFYYHSSSGNKDGEPIPVNGLLLKAGDVLRADCESTLSTPYAYMFVSYDDEYELNNISEAEVEVYDSPSTSSEITIDHDTTFYGGFACLTAGSTPASYYVTFYIKRTINGRSRNLVYKINNTSSGEQIYSLNEYKGLRLKAGDVLGVYCASNGGTPRAYAHVLFDDNFE
ncbi:hypothetical protein [Methanococcus maripaludis]|uniref:Uncharacterized protein n=1 Tax=Methanococcus maripaludis TaxID=39152 RepID=A0A8T4CJB1_METMI|nr:hypothetical protein [Methanococcus maripaludis]MBM7408770.1 hypothetical protein [Methanococcus maripaludis]MBP2219061.1 hypothetical protein [Methanococcus maripaludis]